MIKLENTEVLGWEAAIRGMRNPMNSWEKSDSLFKEGDSPDEDGFMDTVYRSLSGKLYGKDGEHDPVIVGDNDHDLMMRLAKAGSVDAKYRRMIVVTVDITAPLYWWKEFDTYKVGTVANSCSTMHKIQAKEFTLEDFSCEHLFRDPNDPDSGIDIPDFSKEFIEDVKAYQDAKDYTAPLPKSSFEREVKWNYEQGAYSSYEESNEFEDWVTSHYAFDVLHTTMFAMNHYRKKFLETKDKRYWWQMIQLLPSSYNQRRTVMLNYEVLAGIYPKRKNHKLDEWHNFCAWIESLPYSEIITLQEGDVHGEEAT